MCYLIVVVNDVYPREVMPRHNIGARCEHQVAVGGCEHQVAVVVGLVTKTIQSPFGHVIRTIQLLIHTILQLSKGYVMLLGYAMA